MSREFVNARQAARMLGYEVGDGPSASEPGLRALYACIKRNKVQPYRRGQDKRTVLFDRRDIEALLQPVARDRFEHMKQLAIAHARGEKLSA